MQFQHEHGETLALCKSVPHERAEGEAAQRMRGDLRPLAHRDQLQEHAWELYDAVFGAPGMPVSRAHREAHGLIGAAGGVEIVDGEDEVVETAGHGVSPEQVDRAATMPCKRGHVIKTGDWRRGHSANFTVTRLLQS